MVPGGVERWIEGCGYGWGRLTTVESSITVLADGSETTAAGTITVSQKDGAGLILWMDAGVRQQPC
jgi:hypothetical protein